MKNILSNTQAQFGIGCCLLGIVGMVFGGVMTYFLLPMIMQLIMYLIIAAVVIVILAILVKRFLLGGKK